VDAREGVWPRIVVLCPPLSTTHLTCINVEISPSFVAKVQQSRALVE
jgi:hypothetical protein